MVAKSGNAIMKPLLNWAIGEAMHSRHKSYSDRHKDVDSHSEQGNLGSTKERTSIIM